MKDSRSRIGPQGTSARKRSYEIHAAIQFRARREKAWHQGFIRKVSVSGILIQTDQPYPIGTWLEMRFVLPVDLKGKTAAEVTYGATVVRSSSERLPGLGYLAATIEQSRLVRPAC